MGLLHRFIQPGQQLQAVGRDPGHHRSPVFGFAAARDQFALSRRSSRRVTSGSRVIMRLAISPQGSPSGEPAQNAEHVVLRWRRGPRS
jgi:hypothetical protein